MGAGDFVTGSAGREDAPRDGPPDDAAALSTPLDKPAATKLPMPIRAFIAACLDAIEPRRFVSRRVLGDMVVGRSGGTITKRQFGSALQSAHSAQSATVQRRLGSDGKFYYGLVSWGDGALIPLVLDAGKAAPDRKETSVDPAASPAVAATLAATPSAPAAPVQAAGSASNPPTRGKWKMEPHHVAILEASFADNSHPSKQATELLAAELQCKRSTVLAWFRKKREAAVLEELRRKRLAEAGANGATNGHQPVGTQSSGSPVAIAGFHAGGVGASPNPDGSASESATGGSPECGPLTDAQLREEIHKALHSLPSPRYLKKAELSELLPKSLACTNKELGAALRGMLKTADSPIVRQDSADGKSWVYGLKVWGNNSQLAAGPAVQQNGGGTGTVASGAQKGTLSPSKSKGEVERSSPTKKSLNVDSNSTFSKPTDKTTPKSQAYHDATPIDISRKRKTAPEFNPEWSESKARDKIKKLESGALQKECLAQEIITAISNAPAE